MNQKSITTLVEKGLADQKAGSEAKEISLVLLLMDNSTSIRVAGNEQAVIDGYNEFIDVLKAGTGRIRFKTMFLNSSVEIPFQPLANVQSLSCETYRLFRGTPLFARARDALMAMMEEAAVYHEQGYAVRTMSFFFSDGGNNHGVVGAPEVRFCAKTMLATENHIIGACAVDDGYTNFWEVFASMGVPKWWIWVLKNNPGEVRKAIETLGNIAAAASTDAQSFRQARETGFGPADESKVN